MLGRPVLLAAFIIFISVAVAAAATNYSADLESVSPLGSFTSKIYVRDDMQRMEMTAGGKHAVTILRGDKKAVWMLMPENMLYVEMPMDPKRDLLPPFPGADVKAEKEPLGTDTIDGHPSKKYHVNILRDGMKEGSGFVWEAEDLGGLPIRFQTEDKSTVITWKNIKQGGADRALFDIPAGYKKVDVSNPPPATGNPPGR